MLIQNKILAVCVITSCLFCSAIVANQREKCDVIQFSFTEPGSKSSFHNFTEQHFTMNGRPIYYSLHGTKSNQNQTIIWWNNTEKTQEAWIGQTRNYDKEKEIDFVPVFKMKRKLNRLRSKIVENWETLWVANDIVVKSRWCLTYKNKCLGNTNDKIKHDGKDYPGTSKGLCIFPFKHKNEIHNSCTMVDFDGLWCATSVDANLDWQTRGFCTETCQFEGMYFPQF